MVRNNLAQRDSALSKNVPAALQPARSYISPPDIFAEVHWQSAQRFREACDSYETATRWHVIVIPSDNVPRFYVLCGTLEQVTRRAKVFFPSPQTLIATPASLAGPESIDRRLHVPSVRTTRRLT